MPKPIKIFKVGTHTAMQGTSGEYTKTMLAECVAAYNPELHEAPMVLGHPKHADPAMGWVDHLELTDDGILLAHPKQVDADFAENVNAGKHNKVSASFYLPDSPNNPAPGTLYLRHVGFLGAQVPAVKGLGSVSFAEGESGIVDFGDWGLEATADLFRGLREWIIEKDGQETADRVLSNWLITSIREYADVNKDMAIAAFAELGGVNPVPTTPPAAQEPAKTAREIELEQQLVAAQAINATAAREKEKSLAADFAEGLVAKGKLPPVMKEKTIALLCATQAGAGVVSFAEGEEQSLATGLKQLLSDLPVLVNFAEHAHKANANPNITNPKNPLQADAEHRASAQSR